MINVFNKCIQPPADGYLLDIVDSEWREDTLPFDQILVPTEKLPDPEADNGDPHITLSEQVMFLYSSYKLKINSLLSWTTHRNKSGQI